MIDCTKKPPKLPANWKSLPKDTGIRAEVREWRAKCRDPKKIAEDDKKNPTNTNKVFSNIEQWILTRNMEELDKKNKAWTRGSDTPDDKPDFRYYTFRQVDGNGAQLVNKLRGIDNLNVFYRIKTSTLSLLQPKLKLYKVTYENFQYNADKTVDVGSIKPLPGPCYREFKFSDNFGVETAASVQDYLSYETTKPSFRNVGFESFMITQNGEAHGAIENNIECKLSLSFKSIKDLNASPPGEPSLRYVDLILWPPARFLEGYEEYNPKHYEIKALIGYTALSEQQLNSLELPREEIKAMKEIEKLNQVVSLGLYDYNINIEENGSVKLTASYRGRLETVVGSNQVNIFQDNIRINPNGELELSDERTSKFNISHYYSLSTRINLIYLGLLKDDCLGADCQAKKNLISMTKEDPVFGALLAKVGPDGTGGRDFSPMGLDRPGDRKTFNVKDEVRYFVWFKNDLNIKRLMAKMEEMVGKFKQRIFMSFMEQLIKGDNKGRTRVFTATSGKGQIRAAVGLVESSPEGSTGAPPAEEGADDIGLSIEDFNNVVESFTTAVGSGDIDFSFGRPSEEEVKTAEALGKDLSSLVTIDGLAGAQDAQEPDGEKVEKTKEIPTPSWVSEKDGIYKFFFVYLGDIIELACKNADVATLKFEGEVPTTDDAIYFFGNGSPQVGNEANIASYPLTNARILLGPLEYIGSDHRVKKMNLARMPISLRNFRTWFLKKIIKRRRTQMPLGEFLSSLINDLVVPSLGVGMPEKRKPANARANIISITLPGIQKTEIPSYQGCGAGSIYATEELLPVQRVIDTDSHNFEINYMKLAGEPRSSESMIKSSYDYLLIYITTHMDIINRKGDPAKDIKDGIYHFNIGSDQGLLRKMDFTRVNIPHMAALRSEQMERPLAAGDPSNIEQLKFPHNSDVYLIGTSLFVPGMFYYVNPSMAGLGSVESAASIAHQLNLGGYHMIQQVSTNISAGKFVTKVVGVQQFRDPSTA